MEYQILQEAMRVLFIVGLPLVLVTAIAGTIAAALMAATTIHEPALDYAVRLVVVVVVLFFLTPLAVRSLLSLMEFALQ